MLNRLWTFKAGRRAGKVRQAALYLGVQCVGWMTNLAIYAACLLLFPQLKALILIPLVLGAAGGMVVNFLGSKHLAFRAPIPGKAVAETPTA